MSITVDHLRRFAVARSLFTPTTLKKALDRLGFVQADPIRAPARAQDLTLRHRVKNYRAGDLERRYSTLDVEEDCFINYGFVTRSVYDLMHPREGTSRWPPARRKQAEAMLDFVREHGAVHPRQAHNHFAHGKVTNYWGGSSNATTHLLDALHYCGLLRVARREGGIRIYAASEQPAWVADGARREGQIDALIDVAVRKYAPLPGASLATVVSRLRHAVPHRQSELKTALQRARERLARTRVDGIDWYWPAGERVSANLALEAVRLLAPFDPVVWDRRRFELLWGWAYRFEAYTPESKRKLGYYALPLLWRDRIVGWGNVSVARGTLHFTLGSLGSRPKDRAFSRELDAELVRLRDFLGLKS